MNWRARFKTWRRSRQIAGIRAEEQRIVDRDLRERAAIAAAFNQRYVGGARYDVSSDAAVPGDLGNFGMVMKVGHRWMCPNCNAVHPALRFSMWVGTIFPACCKHPEGSRNNDLRSGFNLKRPLGYCGPGGLYKRLLDAGLEPNHPELKKAPY